VPARSSRQLAISPTFLSTIEHKNKGHFTKVHPLHLTNLAFILLANMIGPENIFSVLEKWQNDANQTLKDNFTQALFRNQI